MKKGSIARKLRYKVRDIQSRLLLFINPSIAKNIRYGVIISPGRTGTRTLGFLFDKLSNCISRHEPRPTLLDLVVKTQSGFDNNSILKQIDIRRGLYFFKAKSEEKIFVESNYGLTFLLENLLKNKPNCKAVFITRHPVDYIISAFSKDHNSNGKDYRLFDSKDFRNRLDDDFFMRKSGCKFEQLSRFEKLCWNYRLYHDEYFRLIDAGYAIPLFKLEVLSEVQEEAVTMAKALGIDVQGDDNEVLLKGMQVTRNASKSYIIDGYNGWTSDEKTQFESIIGPILYRLEYTINA